MCASASGGRADVEAQPLPAWLEEPPVGVPPLLVSTAPQVLPFDHLTSDNFEKLVVRLVRLDADVEHCQQYGVPGQDQHGIDLYARLRAPGPSGRWYRTVQCRNVAAMTDTDIAAAVEDFLDGLWAARSDVFVIATRVDALRTERAEAAEAAAASLRQVGVRFEIWDGQELSHRLRELPLLVESFFGPDGARRFCPPTALVGSGELDGTEQMLPDRPSRANLMVAKLAISLRGIPTSPVVWT